MGCRFSPEASRREFTPVDNGFIAEYLPDASGVQLQVYLYGLMQCYYPAVDGTIADALGITEQEVTDAFCFWQVKGLVRILGDNPLSVEYLALPDEGTPVQPGKYTGLVSSLNTLTAPRQFGARELAHVYDWIEVFGLDEGAVLELVSYCMDKKSRRVGINYMTSVAQAWAENGIRSFEDARREIESYDLKKNGASKILLQWNKKRRPTKAEMELYEKWTQEWGFSEDAIMAVLPRLTASGTPNFVYLDEQLESLREKELTDSEGIRDDDARAAQEKAFARILFDRAGKAEVATKTQLAQIRMFLEDMGIPRELMLYAAERSRGASEPFGMIKHLLSDWNGKGIRTVEAAMKAEQESQTGKKTRGARKDYAQREIKESDFDQIFLDLNEDI